MNSNTEEVGKIIRQKRLEKGLSQREFANLLHVTSATVSKWENAKHLPDPATLVNISIVLGCATDELLGRVRASPKENTEAMPQIMEALAVSPTTTETVVEASGAADPPQFFSVPPPSPKSRVRIFRKTVILPATLVLIATFCFIAVSYAMPRYKVVDSFYGDDSGIQQMHENAYFMIVEYNGVVQDEDILSHSSHLKDNCLDSYREDTAMLIILYFQNYNPEQDYEATADFVYTYYLKSPAEAQ